MDTRRIIAHIWMYILIMLGVVVAFLFLPPLVLFSRKNHYYLSLIIFPLIFFVIYNLASAFYYRVKSGFKNNKLEKLTREKSFGRMVHPTCTTLTILAWTFFIYSPTLQIFMADIWMTVVILSWIRLEKGAYTEKSPKPIADISGP